MRADAPQGGRRGRGTGTITEHLDRVRRGRRQHDVDRVAVGRQDLVTAAQRDQQVVVARHVRRGQFDGAGVPDPVARKVPDGRHRRFGLRWWAVG
jgi:hypothetical protein